MWVIEDGKMVNRPITYVPGLLKIFDEIVVNAADNKHRDDDMKFIKVVVADDYISVENDGAGIPVEMHAQHNVYVPQMVFGQLLSGDNYDDDEERVVGGRNGYGAKLTNIFSTSFCIETVDSKSGKKYSQTWSDNMANVSKPKIYSAGKRKDFTRVTFRPDFEKFGLTGFTPDIRALLHKRVYDIAGTTAADVRVHLNGARLNIKNFKQYCGLYVDRPLVHEVVNDRWEICVTMSPDQQPQQVSFCNSICTVKGGEHVKYIADVIAKGIVPLRAFKDLSVKPFMVQRSMFIFVNALIINPSFDSQTKETLTTRSKDFGPVRFKPVIDEKLLKRIANNSGIIDEVAFFARAKSQRALERKSGGSKKTKLKGIPKLDDANWAGGRRSHECTLILTEGDSAKSLAIAGLSVIGRNKYGVFPLKGKLLNVRDASNSSVIGNAEVQNIMKIMGLKIGTVYTDVSPLRYSRVMIMTDQDHDGSHIKGLVINFFHHFWPSLLRQPNFLQVFITPIVKCTRRQQAEVFYTTPEFYQWQQAEARTGWKIKYYKGLGTSSAKEAKEYFSNLARHLIPFEVLRDGSPIDMCFNKQRVADRKQWIAAYQAGTFMNFNVSEMKYSDFVNREYIIMAVQSNLRAIPHVMDGLKPSQRKILFACIKRKLHSEIKVAQLAGYTSEHAAYHHGEASLNGAIVGMAQDFVGSNNINLLMPNGQFGTRLMGGKDAASPRYIFTQLSELSEMIFHPRDAALYIPLEDDNQKIEPKFYVPVLPMLLINGSSGIGTGWSSTVPSYNPLDIIRQIRNLLSGRAAQRMTPWFKGFTGTVTAVTGTTKYKITGKHVLLNPTTIHITELPVGTWTNNYKEFLEKAVEGYGAFKKGDIVSIKANHTDTTVDFKVQLTTTAIAKLGHSGIEKAFKLVGTVDIGNMHAFTSTGNMRKYVNELDILQDFFTVRRQLYHDRKRYQTGALEDVCHRLQQKIAFVQLVVAGQFSFAGKQRTQLLEEFKKHAFAKEAPEYLLAMPMWNLTQEKKDSLADELAKHVTNLQQLQKTSPDDLWRHDLNKIENILKPPSKKRSHTSQGQPTNKRKR
jgi:DNA topoisomerase-2